MSVIDAARARLCHPDGCGGYGPSDPKPAAERRRPAPISERATTLRLRLGPVALRKIVR